MNEKKPLFFDIEEQEWVDAPNGARSVIFQATPLATMQNWEMPLRLDEATTPTPPSSCAMCAGGRPASSLRERSTS